MRTLLQRTYRTVIAWRTFTTMPQIQLKTAKGMRDWDGKDILIRDKIFSTITDVFKRHGAVNLDTPAMERKELLTGKYGEDSKLIYDLQDQGGELLSMRYDLTVPFARYLAMNAQIQKIKRYHIAKVYRRDQPAMTKGRMREFYQCDFDIAGTYGPMVSDAEVLKITCRIFEELGWHGKYTIKINHRKILDGIFAVCGVPVDKTRAISSAVDKLDKSPWSDVRREMTEEKQLDPDVADKIGAYVQLKGGRALLETLQANPVLAENESAKQGLDDMALLFETLAARGLMQNFSFDMSLARGLDYYTGVIFEVVDTENSAPKTTTGEAQRVQKTSRKQGGKDFDEDRSSDPSVGVGSIAAGGRYDNLVGMFSGKSGLPCAGISFGVDRIFSIVKSRLEGSAAALRSSETEVWVMAFGGKGFNGLFEERLAVCDALLDARIKTEYSMKKKPKLDEQFKDADKGGVPFAVIFGEEELAAGRVKIKELGLPEGHAEKEGVLVERSNLVEEVKTRLKRWQAEHDEMGGLFNAAKDLTL